MPGATFFESEGDTAMRAMKKLMVALALTGAMGCGAQAERATAPEAPRAEVATTVESSAPIEIAELPPSEPAPVVLPMIEVDRFFTREDAPIRSALLGTDISEVERGRGGRSLGFKITLADGTRGYFKPDQTFGGMSWYA